MMVPAFVSDSVIPVTALKVLKAPKALRLVLIFAAVSLMMVPAGILSPVAKICATDIGVATVAALATVNAAADTFTVLLLDVLMVGAVVVLTAVELGDTVEMVVVDTVCVILLIVEILTITIPTHTWLCLSKY